MTTRHAEVCAQHTQQQQQQHSTAEARTTQPFAVAPIKIFRTFQLKQNVTDSLAHT
jgi:hypothetical protein